MLFIHLIDCILNLIYQVLALKKIHFLKGYTYLQEANYSYIFSKQYETYIVRNLFLYFYFNANGILSHADNTRSF